MNLNECSRVLEEMLEMGNEYELSKYLIKDDRYKDALQFFIELGKSLQDPSSIVPEEKDETYPCDACKGGETNCVVDCPAHKNYMEAISHNACRAKTLTAVGAFKSKLPGMIEKELENNNLPAVEMGTEADYAYTVIHRKQIAHDLTAKISKEI